MKNYKIILTNTEKYDVIIYSENIENPLSIFDELEIELQRMNLKNNNIIFDMILCRGNGIDRFIEGRFDGNSIVRNSLATLNIDKKNILRRLSSSFLKNNIELLEDSILSSVQKKMLLKGIAI